ncbi:MAG: hypothetical protein D6714_10375 [Bacteroidetes bacterium]|nr:MAG: hypothetical protein D6714_10375 [Bacteroidota bacterium]
MIWREKRSANVGCIFYTKKKLCVFIFVLISPRSVFFRLKRLFGFVFRRVLPGKTVFPGG